MISNLKFRFFIFVSVLISNLLFSQKLSLLHQEGNSNLRGLSVVDNNTIWVSGSKGTIGKTQDGGKNWKWIYPDGYADKEFRDIHAFDSLTAIVMTIASPGILLKTIDGGKNWNKVYENTHPNIFLDAIDFRGKNGVCVGDPIDGRIFLIETSNEGNSWQLVKEGLRPRTDSGEAFFAASGGNIKWFDSKNYAFVSGGMKSNFYCKQEKINLPLLQGSSSAGANGFDLYKKTILVCGGDFSKDTLSDGSLAISKDGGKTFSDKIRLGGYRSSISFASKKHILACGTSGVDISIDGGKSFTQISKESFNTCTSLDSRTWILIGKKGRIASLKME